MSDYNGWSNYATWRIKLELFDDCERFDEEVTPEQLKEEAEEAISEYGNLKDDCLAVSYALAFLQEVDWYEIAEALNKDKKEIDEYNEKNK